MAIREDSDREIENSARAFEELFRRMEHAMKRSDFCADHKDYAEADWDKLSKALGDEFFKEVAASGKATTLKIRLNSIRLFWSS